MLKMKENRQNLLFQRGQSIVIFTISLTVLLILMALVLDGGVLLLRRREAQASADAGALRGATLICGTAPEAADYVAADFEAKEFADDENQGNTSVVTFPGTNTIQVVTTITQAPALAGLMGFGDINVEALARAECVPAGTGTHLMPFVFACEPPEGVLVADYDDCVQKIAGDPPVYPGDYYLVHDSEESEEDLWCIYPPNTEPSDPEYEEGSWDCDFDNDGVDDIVNSANRGWISLETGNTINAGILSGWIEDGFDGVVSTHMWLSTATGSMSAVFNTVKNALGPDYPIIIIPIYNAVCYDMASPQTACPGKWHESPDPQDIWLEINGGQKYYHIAAYAAFQITCVHVQGPAGQCDYREYVALQDGGDFITPGTPKSIEGYFVNVIDPDLGVGTGLDTGAYVVRLSR